MALPFYKIKFSKEQRALLKQKEIELVFSIDEQGVAKLEDIQGIADQAIQDSLQQAAAKVPKFHPRTVDGAKESSLYFLKFQLPDYGTENILSRPQGYFSGNYTEPALEDFEYIHKSGERLDILFGAVGNTFVGKPADYLSPGGGMKMDLMYTGKRGYGGGMIMSFYGNKLKQNYPINSSRDQNSAPPTLLIGAGINKVLQVKEKSELMVQLELSYAVQNITPKLETQDEDWVQLNGFSPGLVLNYLRKIGKDKPVYYYGRPSIFNHYVNFHGAIRPVFFDLKEATGLMAELGVSYRLGIQAVDEYRLKQ